MVISSKISIIGLKCIFRSLTGYRYDRSKCWKFWLDCEWIVWFGVMFFINNYPFNFFSQTFDFVCTSWYGNLCITIFISNLFYEIKFYIFVCNIKNTNCTQLKTWLRFWNVYDLSVVLGANARHECSFP